MNLTEKRASTRISRNRGHQITGIGNIFDIEFPASEVRRLRIHRMQRGLRSSAHQRLVRRSWSNQSGSGLWHLLWQRSSIVCQLPARNQSTNLSFLPSFFFFRNTNGPVIGKQTEHHASIYAAAEALKSLPKGLFTKVCICTDSTYVVHAMSRLLPQWSENNYRMLSDPMRRCENLPTLEFINEYVRLNPFTYRFKYTPSDCYIPMMICAMKLAKEAIKKWRNKWAVRIEHILICIHYHGLFPCLNIFIIARSLALACTCIRNPNVTELHEHTQISSSTTSCQTMWHFIRSHQYLG